MSKEQYFGDGIPDRLRQLSVEDMPIEKLYILDTVMDDSEFSDLGDEVEFDDDAIYVDKTQAGGLGRLAIDKRCAVKALDKIDPADFNSVILMKAYVQDGQVKIWGDSAFFDAAVYMTKLVSDKYSKCEESDEQVLKSDAALRKSELQDKAKKAISSFSKTCECAVGSLNKWVKKHRK